MATILPPPGPALPDFTTLLLKGQFHASAPIHLALSYVTAHDAQKVVVLAPSRTRFSAEVKQLKDGWLNDHGGGGRVTAAAMRINILYPPTPAHLALLLSLFHEPLKEGKDFLHQKVIFSTVPSLVILCEPSAFFAQSPEATVSSYLLVVSQCLAAVSALETRSGKKTAFALLDSGLDALRLPILQPPNLVAQNDEVHQPAEGHRREAVALLVERYFEWIGETREGSDTGTNDVELTLTLRLSRNQNQAEQDRHYEFTWTRRTDQRERRRFSL